MKKLIRCAWVPAGDRLYEKYHDEEWGVPVRDDQKIFEFIVLESAQAGLSWATVLKKRENYRRAFAGFDPVQVAKFGDKDLARLMGDAGIIRNRAKIEAAIGNARVFIKIQKEFSSFSDYMWRFTQAEVWAKDLKQRGFRFFGPTTAYAHMQAIGMVNDHELGCFRRALV